MDSARVRRVVINDFSKRTFIFWIAVRTVSAFGPLLATYIFAKGISYIEKGESFEAVVRVFFALLIVEIVEHFLRISSKTRLSLYSEQIIMNIQKDLIVEMKPIRKLRKHSIQSIRNLTQALRAFIIFMYENGIPALVSFAAIPIILFFVDKRIFFIQIILYAIYLVVTYFFSDAYEKHYEGFDQSREGYYAKFMTSNKIGWYASFVVKKYKQVEDITLIEWLTLQNLVSVANFIIIVILVKDIYSGYGHIADLILVVGYTKESKKFLNEVTSLVNSAMMVKAGTERLVAMSCGKVSSIV